MYIKVSLFEDNHSLRDMLFQLINGSEGLRCSGAFSDASDLVFKIEKSVPDVVLMDIDLPGISGIEAVAIIKEKFPAIQILMQTVFEDEEKIFSAICAGASGYLLKNVSPSQLIESLKEVYLGGAPMSASIARKVLEGFRKQSAPGKKESFNLSEREMEVLQYLMKGMSYKMIAAEFNISIDTIKFHTKNIYTKLHVNSKSEAVIKALKHRIV